MGSVWKRYKSFGRIVILTEAIWPRREVWCFFHCSSEDLIERKIGGTFFGIGW